MPSSSSSFPSFNQIMDRRRKHRASIDELALVKAAAWAWYQRGSGFEGRSMREYDATRSSREPKPSRYKLEAIRRAKEVAMEEEMGFSGSFRSMLSPNHTDNSLLDRYEIERISQELDHYIESSNAENIDGRDALASYSKSESGMRRIKGTTNNKKKKGFWLLRHGVGCGSRNDVVENIGFSRQRTEKRLPLAAAEESGQRLVDHA